MKKFIAVVFSLFAIFSVIFTSVVTQVFFYWNEQVFGGIYIVPIIIIIGTIFLFIKCYLSFKKDGNSGVFFGNLFLINIIALALVPIGISFVRKVIQPYYYKYHTVQRENSLIVSNRIDKSFELKPDLPIGVEVQYSLEIRNFLFSTTHRLLGGKEYLLKDHLPQVYLYSDYGALYGQGSTRYTIKEISPSPTGSYKGYSKLKVGIVYTINSRIYPSFLYSRSTSFFPTSDEFESLMCIRKSIFLDRYLEKPEKYVQLPVLIDWYKSTLATTTNKYSLNEFYNNAIASGIPFCD